MTEEVFFSPHIEHVHVVVDDSAKIGFRYNVILEEDARRRDVALAAAYTPFIV